MTILIAFIFGGVIMAAAAKDKPPEVDKDGLHLVHDSELRVVYRRPGVDLTQYDKIILVDAYVAFRKNWRREQNESDPFRVNKRDVEEIKQRVAEEFAKEFTKELEKKGYSVVAKTETGPDVLIVRPAIINLDIEAPDTRRSGSSRVFAASAGQMTLFAELYDSVSNQIIARAVDPQADRGFGAPVTLNRVTNKAAEDRIVRRWADILAGHLHAAQSP